MRAPTSSIFSALAPERRWAVLAIIAIGLAITGASYQIAQHAQQRVFAGPATPTADGTIDLPNRKSSVQARANPESWNTPEAPWFILFGGIFCTGLCAFVVFSRASRIEHRLSDQAAAQGRHRLSTSVLDATNQGVMITNANLIIVEVNPAFEHTTGYSRSEAIGQTPALLSSGRHDRAFYKKMWTALHETGGWQGEVWNRRKDGKIYPEWLSIVSVRNEASELTHYAGLFSDISTQVHIRQRLHTLAYYDALTGLPNRALFQDRLNNTLAIARREQSLVALFFLDLDRFKTINDTLGHSTGDALLKQVTARLQKLLRESDTIARLGGDEFTLVTRVSTNPDAVGVIAEKIVACFVEPFEINDHELFITTSIGISLFPKDGADQETLRQNADIAMYRAKAAGRNTYQFYQQAMNARFQDRLELETALRRALDRAEFRLVYQPKHDLRTGQIVGAEALIRWQHPQRGLISPATFIPVAEESGLMGKIGEWVLREACQQAQQWRRDGTEIQISVNLSAQQIKPSLVTLVNEVISAAQLPPQCLELEITESAMMGDVELSIGIISALSDLGVEFSVDDFGTGYSSLSYLKRFSITKLKIDKSFIDDVTTDEGDAQIATTIIAMAHNLNLTVIAEGVETQAQLDFLRAQGCDQAQGYLLHRPLPPEALSQVLAQQATRPCDHRPVSAPSA
jgi:diguanylate cyclase (GGDEF)-like protein/PAS domain S-box-containing protein